MSKPTPGPYTVVTGCDSAEVTADNHRMTIATFHAEWCDEYDRLPKAEANARAWVEGREAAEKLDRIRRVRDDWLRDEHSDTNAIELLSHILDEAKP
jgi:hypothetical protein